MGVNCRPLPRQMPGCAAYWWASFVGRTHRRHEEEQEQEEDRQTPLSHMKQCAPAAKYRLRRFHWPRGPKRSFEADCLLGVRIRVPLKA